MKRCMLLLAALVMVLTVSTAWASLDYDYTNLGRAVPMGQSNDRQFVVDKWDGMTYLPGYLDSPTGTITAFPALGGPTGTDSEKMSTGGVIFGRYKDSSQYFTWDPQVAGSLQNYNDPSTGKFNPYAMNSAGVMVGGRPSSSSIGMKSPVRWDSGTITPLSYDYDDSPYGTATAINELGGIVGNVRESGDEMAVYWAPGSTVGALIAEETDINVRDINNLGRAVGSFQDWDPNLGYDRDFAFSWTESGGMQMLTGLSEAYFINDAGQIVGIDLNSNWVIWDPDTQQYVKIKDFLPQGQTYTDISHIAGLDERGVLSGWVSIDGTYSGFVLTPTPIPGAVWLLGSGLVGLFGWRCKQRVH